MFWNKWQRKSLRFNLDNVFDKPSQHRCQIFFIFLALAGMALLIGYGIIWICAAETFPIYQAVLEGEEQVYDGDTLKDVRIVVWEPTNKPPKEPKELWAGIWIMPNGTIEVETDIRIAGIDTPEKRASTNNPDGSKRSEASRDKEKTAANASRQALIDLLKDNEFRLTITNPQHGKYAGRTVADVSVIDEDVAKYLIRLGHAKPYDGGTKPKWDWGK